VAEQKTKPTSVSVDEFVESVPDERRRADSVAMLKMMRRITGLEPRMWGSSMAGFGEYHYKYESGREGDYFVIGFSPRKAALTIYVMPGLDRYTDLLDLLGPHTTGKSCLYIKRLNDVDISVLERLLRESYLWMTVKHGKTPARSD
jgi:hypothetical protein